MIARLPLALALALAFALTGCTFENSPSGQTASSGGGGSFAMSGNQGFSGATERKSFESDGSTAKGSYSVNLGGGSIAFEIQDDDGVTVWSYSRSTPGQAGSTFTTRSGAAGTWTATVKMSGFSGQYAFEGRD